MIKIAIIDDHTMFRDGVASLINDIPDMNVVWSAANRTETMQNFQSSQPDVVLMDLSLGDESGFELTRELLSLYPSVKILALSMHYEDNYIVEILEIGASGYLLKDAGSEEMLTAIRKVYQGEIYYSKHVSEVLIKHITRGSRPQPRDTATVLTKREVEIIKLIADEYSNPEIAQKLFISIRTVDTHRRNLLEKLGVRNTAGLVKYALKHNLIENKLS